MRILFLSLFGIFALLTAPNFSEAQISLSGVNGNQSSLVFTPFFPEPHTEYTVTLDAYSYDLVGSTIRWFQDGVEIENSQNEREIALEAGSLGVKSTIIADIRLRSGGTIQVERSLTPSYIDLLVEADTFTPSAYKGAPIASTEASVTVTAFPHFSDSSQPQELTYTWKLNNTVLLGGGVRGQNTVSFTIPKRQNSFVTVEVANANGVVVARRSMVLATKDPEVFFYQDNPLRGLNTQVIGKEITLTGEEMTVQAAPYFMKYDTEDIQHDWFLDNKGLFNPSQDKTRITLEGGSLSGVARIGYRIQHLTNFLQGARSDFLLRVKETN